MSEQELVNEGICPKCSLEFTVKLRGGTCPECHGAILKKASTDYGTYRLYEQKDRPDRVEISLPMNEKIAIQKVVCRGCLGCADGCAKLYTAYREAEIDRIQQYWFGNQAFKHKATKQILALFPDTEELDKAREQIAELTKKLDDREKDLIDAKREEGERIVSKMNRRDVGGINPEWALCDKDYQALKATPSSKEVADESPDRP